MVWTEAPVAPPAEPPVGPPESGLLWSELGVPLDVAKLAFRGGRLLKAPKLPGVPIMDVPGWRAPEHALGPFRSYLRWLGADARGWGQGPITSDPEARAAKVVPLIRDWAEAAGQPVHLVGFSLGGVVARYLARQAGEAVASVTTLGSPIIGGPIHTVARRRFSPEENAAIAARVEASESGPLRCAVTVMYAPRDGVVNWRACLDHRNPHAEHHEIDATHFGLGLHPRVWWHTVHTIHRARSGGPGPRSVGGHTPPPPSETAEF